MTLLLGLVIIAAAVYAVIRRVDVRLALVLAALALATVAEDPPAIVRRAVESRDAGELLHLLDGPMGIVRTFLATLVKEQFVIPICTALGFAYVLRHTGCDQHLVHLLVRPLRLVRPFLIPGAVLVGVAVNIPVVSQTSTAVCIGAVLVPLLRAARLSPVTTGAALLLGSSLGGELLNPGAPELITVSSTLKIPATACVAHVLPLLALQVAVATAVFWLLSLRAEARVPKEDEARVREEAEAAAREESFRVSLLKAAVPLVPLVLLFLTGPPLQLLQVPHDWLVGPKEPEGAPSDSRLIGVAMLVGVVVAAVVSRQSAGAVTRVFFEGAGSAFTYIIALIVAATCFGEGVKQIGFDAVISRLVAAAPGLLLPVAGAVPLAFALLSGSGMAATQSLYRFFVDPARALGMDPVHVGAVVSISAAAGRTMSPVAAVTLMSASLTETGPLELARRVAGPVLISTAVMVLAAALIAARQ
jgi:DcuC family C4-dicarboxylate transporter